MVPLMLANVLNSERGGGSTSVMVVRAFVRLRAGCWPPMPNWRAKARGAGTKYTTRSSKLSLMPSPAVNVPPEPKRREIGFHVKYDEGKPRSKQRL